jgi:hypothetical protein
MRNIQNLLKGDMKEWYETHQNTAALLQAVVASLDVDELSGDEIWQLMRLTWITNNVNGVSSNHWRTLKVPALATLFGTRIGLFDNQRATIRAMALPAKVKSAALLDSGAVNFRPVWRNAARTWCRKNRAALIAIIDSAIRLGRSQEERIALAAQIEVLPVIPSPNNKANARAVLAVSPLVAFLDPYRRFPIINGRPSIERLLTKLGLTNRGLEDQVRHLTGLIGQFGIEDAFLLDIFADEIVEIGTRPGQAAPRKAKRKSETHLPDYDVDERLATLNTNTVVYRNRHNAMTKALQQLFQGCKLVTSYDHDCNYDVLVKDYDQNGRDLLIEAKPDPDKGAIRIAVGQLLDYRRFLPRPVATDLAVLTILPPSQSHIDLLDELQITAIWFTNETCQRIGGTGRAWPAIRKIQAGPERS